eukprot:2579748-Rhodomonas_salina.1
MQETALMISSATSPSSAGTDMPPAAEEDETWVSENKRAQNTVRQEERRDSHLQRLREKGPRTPRHATLGSRLHTAPSLSAADASTKREACSRARKMKQRRRLRPGCSNSGAARAAQLQRTVSRVWKRKAKTERRKTEKKKPGGRRGTAMMMVVS